MSYHEEEALGKVYDGRLMRRLLTYLAPYRLTVATALVLIVAVSALKLVGPYLTKIAIDDYIARGDVGGLTLIAGIYILALLAQFFLSFLQVYVMNLTGQRIMFDMRREIFAHLQQLHPGFFDRNPVGRLVTRVTTDVDALNELFTAGVVSVFGDVFMLLGIMIVLITMSWKLALVTFAVLPALFAVSVVFKRKVRETYRRVRTRIARMNAFIQENITGMQVVQLFRQEDRKFRQFSGLNREHMEANLDSVLYYAVFYPIVEVLGAVAIALIIWYGGGQILAGGLTLGALVAFVQYSEKFFRPISDLTEKFNILQAAMASSERIFGLLDTPPAIESPARAHHPVRRPARRPVRRSLGEGGGIDFEGVWFAYQDEDWVLRDIDLRVRPGERLAVVGHTGAGKTSLTSLLLRFYDVQRGRVLVEGADVRDWDLRLLRRQFGIVLQDVHLFSGTIASNIRLGNQDISEGAIEEAAAAVHLDRFIRRLPKGLQEEVRERGATLSTGEKQLISFARALAHDPQVLILDEATSSVDTETEILIREALDRLMVGRTSIVIAHRLSTVQKADRIVVLHKGRIREVGTHQELLLERGIYYRLYQLQYQEQEASLAAGELVSRADGTGHLVSGDLD
ncbi:MAG: ABC transporter ATP-binding protein [Acidobacteriota bacterium]